MRRHIKIYLLATLILAWPAMVHAQFSFETNNGAIIITGYTGNPITLNIPSTTNGYAVVAISYGAFRLCSTLSAVNIPNTVTNIGQRAFYACFSLTEIKVNTNNPVYTSVNGVLFNRNKGVLIDYPSGLGGGYTIPNGVTNIGLEAFYWCSNLTSVTIANTVVSIGDTAFGNCLALTNVAIPNSVTSVGVGVFSVCSNLKNVVIPDGLAYIGDSMFQSSGLINITIPNTITNIGDSAFCGCQSLTNITLPSSITGVKNFAFLSCNNLKNIYFSGNTPSTGSGLFGGVNNGIIYYLPGTTNWPSTFSGLPTVLWNPKAQTNDGNFGIKTNRFGFNLTGSSNLVIIVEACTNLLRPVWRPVQTNTLTTGSAYFSDSQWTNYPSRFYRLRSP